MAALCAPDDADRDPAWRGVRTILVPPDIVGVARRSPQRAKRKTPWRPQPDGTVITSRAGSRDWFADKVFVEARDGHDRAGYGMSLAVHAAAAVALVVFLVTRPDQIVVNRLSAPLVMPAIAIEPPHVDPVRAPTPLPAPRSRPEATARPPAAPPPRRPEVIDEVPAPAAPVVAPSGVAAETGNEAARAKGVEGGVEGGVAGGVPHGVADGSVKGGVPNGSSASAQAAVRVGPNMTPPRKIKDVKPVYPEGGVSGRSQGAVIIEATVGVDGKVTAAKVVHSAPPLDQAALEAVRQWEYTPSFLNGVAVAVIITVVVNFSLQ